METDTDTECRSCQGEIKKGDSLAVCWECEFALCPKCHAQASRELAFQSPALPVAGPIVAPPRIGMMASPSVGIIPSSSQVRAASPLPSYIQAPSPPRPVRAISPPPPAQMVPPQVAQRCVTPYRLGRQFSSPTHSAPRSVSPVPRAAIPQPSPHHPLKLATQPLPLGVLRRAPSIGAAPVAMAPPFSFCAQPGAVHSAAQCASPVLQASSLSNIGHLSASSLFAGSDSIDERRAQRITKVLQECKDCLSNTRQEMNDVIKQRDILWDSLRQAEVDFAQSTQDWNVVQKELLATRRALAISEKLQLRAADSRKRYCKQNRGILAEQAELERQCTGTEESQRFKQQLAKYAIQNPLPRSAGSGESAIIVESLSCESVCNSLDYCTVAKEGHTLPLVEERHRTTERVKLITEADTSITPTVTTVTPTGNAALESLEVSSQRVDSDLQDLLAESRAVRQSTRGMIHDIAAESGRATPGSHSVQKEPSEVSSTGTRLCEQPLEQPLREECVEGQMSSVERRISSEVAAMHYTRALLSGAASKLRAQS